MRYRRSSKRYALAGWALAAFVAALPALGWAVPVAADPQEEEETESETKSGKSAADDTLTEWPGDTQEDDSAGEEDQSDADSGNSASSRNLPSREETTSQGSSAEQENAAGADSQSSGQTGSKPQRETRGQSSGAADTGPNEQQTPSPSSSTGRGGDSSAETASADNRAAGGERGSSRASGGGEAESAGPNKSGNQSSPSRRSDSGDSPSNRRTSAGEPNAPGRSNSSSQQGDRAPQSRSKIPTADQMRGRAERRLEHIPVGPPRLTPRALGAGLGGEGRGEEPGRGVDGMIDRMGQKVDQKEQKSSCRIKKEELKGKKARKIFKLKIERKKLEGLDRKLVKKGDEVYRAKKKMETSQEQMDHHKELKKTYYDNFRNFQNQAWWANVFNEVTSASYDVSTTTLDCALGNVPGCVTGSALIAGQLFGAQFDSRTVGSAVETAGSAVGHGFEIVEKLQEKYPLTRFSEGGLKKVSKIEFSPKKMKGGVDALAVLDLGVAARLDYNERRIEKQLKDARDFLRQYEKQMRIIEGTLRPRLETAKDAYKRAKRKIDEIKTAKAEKRQSINSLQDEIAALNARLEGLGDCAVSSGAAQ